MPSPAAAVSKEEGGASAAMAAKSNAMAARSRTACRAPECAVGLGCLPGPWRTSVAPVLPLDLEYAHKFIEVGDLDVGEGVALAAGAGAGAALVAVYPAGLEAQPLGGLDVVAAALGDVQDLVGLEVEESEGHAEVARVGLVGAAVLRRHPPPARTRE